MNHPIFKVVEAIFGMIIICIATAGWYYWKLDYIIAILMGAFGLRMVGHAFDFYFLVATLGAKILVPEYELDDPSPPVVDPSIPNPEEIPTVNR